MSVIHAINEKPLNTDATAAQYASFLQKFTQYVGETEDDGSIYGQCIFSSVGVYPVTSTMKNEFDCIICFNAIVNMQT